MEKTYTLGEEMKAYRGREGLTQRQLGELLGVKQVDISRFENGRKEPPPEVEAAFKALPEKRAEPEPEPKPSGGSGGGSALLSGSGPAGDGATHGAGRGGGTIQGEARGAALGVGSHAGGP